MLAALQQLRRVVLVRYLGASVIALACDMASFLALLGLGLMAGLAAAIGYCIGIVVHWLVSSRKVFAGSVAAGGAARTRQKALFVVSALIGLGVTTAIVAGGTRLGLDPRLAKLIAVGASFTITWLLRDVVVPIARQTRTLLVVVDALSLAAANDLVSAIQQDGWTEVSADGHRGSALAVLPTLTQRSRCSLLCGELREGADDVERKGFLSLIREAHLEATGGGPDPIFHKKALDAIRALSAADRRVRYVSFVRNFGHQVALRAGLRHARGKAVILVRQDGSVTVNRVAVPSAQRASSYA